MKDYEILTVISVETCLEMINSLDKCRISGEIRIL